jgi:hypothetical protein
MWWALESLYYPYCDSEQLKNVFVATWVRKGLRETRFFEPLNEDVWFFVNPNLRIKSCVSHVLLHLIVLFLLLTFLLSISCIRSLLLSISLVVLILLTIVIVALELVDYLIRHSIILPCSRLHSLARFLVKSVVWVISYPRLHVAHCLGWPDKIRPSWTLPDWGCLSHDLIKWLQD